MVNDWNTAEGWFTARSPSSSVKTASEFVGIASMTSTSFDSRSAYAASCVA